MRDDATKDDSFKSNDVWRRQKYRNDVLVKSAKDASGNFLEGRAFTTNSLSGNERNRTFIRVGSNFADVSAISGADDLADGRSFALLDYDQDGWQDIALMSLNEPRFKLYRNQLSSVYPQRRSVRIRLIGGQQTAEASSEYSNRNGIGARVIIRLTDGSQMLLQRQSGEGFAGQNSAELHLGLGEDAKIKELEVRWPSGKTTRVDALDIAQPIVIRERAEK